MGVRAGGEQASDAPPMTIGTGNRVVIKSLYVIGGPPAPDIIATERVRRTETVVPNAPATDYL
jgi:hypothetical protein